MTFQIGLVLVVLAVALVLFVRETFPHGRDRHGHLRGAGRRPRRHAQGRLRLLRQRSADHRRGHVRDRPGADPHRSHQLRGSEDRRLRPRQRGAGDVRPDAGGRVHVGLHQQHADRGDLPADRPLAGRGGQLGALQAADAPVLRDHRRRHVHADRDLHQPAGVERAAALRDRGPGLLRASAAGADRHGHDHAVPADRGAQALALAAHDRLRQRAGAGSWTT